MYRARPFTPVRPSKLQTSTTWADMDDDVAVKPAAKGKAVSFVPSRSTKPLTVPVEFKFNNRSKATAPKINDQVQAKSAPAGRIAPGKPRLTVVKPFKFHENSNIQIQEKQELGQKSPYVPLAVRIKKFDQTPDRFKSASKAQSAPVVKSAAPKVTKPAPPKFATDARIKKETKVLSSEERVLEEMKSRAPFKANPVNVKVSISFTIQYRVADHCVNFIEFDY